MGLGMAGKNAAAQVEGKLFLHMETGVLVGPNSHDPWAHAR